MVLKIGTAHHYIANQTCAVQTVPDAERGIALNTDIGIAFCVYCNKAFRATRLAVHLRSKSHDLAFQLATGKRMELKSVSSQSGVCF